MWIFWILFDLKTTGLSSLSMNVKFILHLRIRGDYWNTVSTFILGIFSRYGVPYIILKSCSTRVNCRNGMLSFKKYIFLISVINQQRSIKPYFKNVFFRYCVSVTFFSHNFLVLFVCLTLLFFFRCCFFLQKKVFRPAAVQFSFIQWLESCRHS